MKSPTYALLLAVLSSLCSGCRTEFYSDASIVAVDHLSGKTRVTFTTLLESVYWCPGAEVKETPDAVYVGFVRAWHKARPQVALPATHVPGTVFQAIDIPNPKEKPVILQPANRRVWEKRPNKAPEPTPGPVTPRAGERDSK